MPTISITDSDGIQVINDCYIEYANFAVSTILNRRFNGTMKFKISYNDYLWNYFSHWLHMVSETYDRERNSISPIIRRRNLFVDSGEYEGWSFRDVIITGLETTQTLIHGHLLEKLLYICHLIIIRHQRFLLNYHQILHQMKYWFMKVVGLIGYQ